MRLASGTALALVDGMFTKPSDRGPFCQSCGMPLRRRSDFGAGADGTRVNDYCYHCYDHGEFTEPNLSAEQMSERVFDFLRRQTLMADPEACAFVAATIPMLKRWQTVAAP